MYDFIIIGSGVSGGRIAHELTAGGAKCALLEAGREFGAKTYPPGEINYMNQLFWRGGLELNSDASLCFLRGKCLGGGSVVNQALMNRFTSPVFDEWRGMTGVDFFDEKVFSNLYDQIQDEIEMVEINPRHRNRNADIFTSGLDKLGYDWKPLLRSQHDCKLEKGSDCIVCLGGCPRDAKQSSLVTTIKWARQKGLEVFSEFKASHIQGKKGEVKVRGSWKGKPHELTTGKVVLACGPLGNVPILRRSGLHKKLPGLGKGFHAHPQFMVFGVFKEELNSFKGAFQSVSSDDEKFVRAGYKLENNFTPPISAAFLLPGLGAEHLNLMKKYRNMACVEIAIKDEEPGEIKANGSGAVKIIKPLTETDSNKKKKAFELIKNMLYQKGALQVMESDQGFCLHLMGGCGMGADDAKSVVSPDFKVHGSRNVYIADSSIFPKAPGINPSFTIMALGLKAAREMLKH